MAKHPPSVARTRRSPLMVAIGLMAAAVLAAGCSEQGMAASSDADAPVVIDVTSTAIGVQNRAGLPLTGVTVEVEAFGGLEFTKTLTRIESAERRAVLMSDLRSREGVPFNMRLMRAKAVRVRASDLAGKEYEVELPLD